MKNKAYGFTLVELIVVITILVVLGAVGVVSYSGYSSDARDSTRITDMTNIYGQLDMARGNNGSLPLPESHRIISMATSPIAYQGYAKKKVLSEIKFDKGGRDPKDDTYYTYTTNSKRTQAQLMGYFENYDTSKMAYLPEIGPRAFADTIDYSDRKIGVLGKFIGTLVDTDTQVPIQDIGTGALDVSTSTGYTAYFNSANTATGNLQTAFVTNSAVYANSTPPDLTKKFTTTWKVGAVGYGNGDNAVTFYITTVGDYTIDWGDGTTEVLSVLKPSHTYTTAGDKTIKISGTIQRFYPTNDIFNETDSPGKLISVSDWGDVEWTSFDWMFFGASNLTSLPSTPPNLTHVTSLYRTFFNATNFNQNINNWDVSNVNSMWLTFNSASSFNQPLDRWNVGNVTLMYGMFYSASLFNQNINNWDTSKVTNMASIFQFATSFNEPLDTWNTSSVTTMYGMFAGATAFNQPISNFNTSNVTNMAFMFNNSVNFNRPVSSFNTSNVVTMSSMFNGAAAFNQSVSTFNTDNVENMSSMFNGAAAFNQSVSTFNTTKLTDMSYMFAGATAFNQPLSNFNTSNVTAMNGMFWGASSFNQPLSNFNTSKTTDMSYMFNNAFGFDQNISHLCTTLISTKPMSFDNNGSPGFTNNAGKQPIWGTCP